MATSRGKSLNVSKSQSRKVGVGRFLFETLRLCAFATLFLALPLLAQPVRNGALPGPLPLFPLDNWWNADVSAAPVDPDSAAFINYVGLTRGLHPDFGGDSGDPSSPTYGMPY